MKKVKIFVLEKRKVRLFCWIALSLLLACISLWVHLSGLPANTFIDPKSGIIVIDPGHGGIDGGTNKDGILEKEINLDVSRRLRTFLHEKGYKVVMTRDQDIALDHLDNTGQNRHHRDLNARLDIINGSNAQLFLSIHVNCNFKKPSTDGGIVFYGDTFAENKRLAYCIQRSLNGMEINGAKRTVHDPVEAKYYLLSFSKIPGAIVETAFMSNSTERHLLTTDEFREQLARAVADGAEVYLKQSGEVLLPDPHYRQHMLIN